MKCPKCNGKVEMMVSVIIVAPSEMEGVLSKKNLRSKNARIYAVNWERASYFCVNKECGWTMLPKRIKRKK